MSGKQVAKKSALKMIRFIVVFISIWGLFIACKPRNPYSYVMIRGEMTINTDQQEIKFADPMKPSKQVNKLCFEYTGEVTVSDVNAFPKFTDGMEMRIEASLVDNTGGLTPLDVIGENSPHYLCVVPQDFATWLNISKKETQFLKLILRSDRSIHVRKIEWKAYNSWDLD